MQRKSPYLFLLLVLLLPVASACSGQRDEPQIPVSSNATDGNGQDIVSTSGQNSIIGNAGNTELTETGRITIRNIGEFEFNPRNIDSVRRDIFREGRFSIFDILVHLDERGEINLAYHFDETLNTHVIDSLGERTHWWYRAYYHMGWGENNAFRMDHFPYKDRMTITIGPVNEDYLDEVYTVFGDEVRRRNENGGKIIIPEVIIRGPETRLELTDVEVHSHNLRSDVFQEGVITAIDVIMSLGERGELSYDLKWYENIGSAIIQQYFVERINSDTAYRRCGFVYEAGSRKFGGFRGNHIHLPSDTRILNSPEYLAYFWICI